MGVCGQRRGASALSPCHGDLLTQHKPAAAPGQSTEFPSAPLSLPAPQSSSTSQNHGLPQQVGRQAQRQAQAQRSRRRADRARARACRRRRRLELDRRARIGRAAAQGQASQGQGAIPPFGSFAGLLGALLWDDKPERRWVDHVDDRVDRGRRALDPLEPPSLLTSLSFLVRPRQS